MSHPDPWTEPDLYRDPDVDESTAAVIAGLAAARRQIAGSLDSGLNCDCFAVAVEAIDTLASQTIAAATNGD